MQYDFCFTGILLFFLGKINFLKLISKAEMSAQGQHFQDNKRDLKIKDICWNISIYM